MTASTLKGAIKGTLKGILNTAAPVFSRRSAMDSASARETLLGFSPPPTGTAAADNRCLYYCFPKAGYPVAKTRLAAEELYKLCKTRALAK